MQNIPLVPSNIVRKLGIHAKRNNQEVIVDFLTQEKGSVELNKTQKELLNRWDFADNLLRTRKYKKTEISKMICQKFGVGIATARNDMSEAEFVFGSTRKFSKLYILSNHIDHIDDLMIDAERKDNLDLVAKLMLIRTRAIELMPNEMRKDIPPTKIVFNITQNNTTNELYLKEDFNEADAKRIAADKLKSLNIDITPFNLIDNTEVQDA